MRHSRGFTLMEVIVAVSLLAMLGIILATSTASILGAIQDTREMQDYYHTARVALGRIEREVAMAYLSKHQGENRTTKTVFIGKGNSILFSYIGHRRMTREAVESDEGFIEYKVEHDAKCNCDALVRREKVIIDETPQKGGQRLVLANGVKKLTFQYWDMDKEAWTSDWRVEIDNVQEELLKKAQKAAMGTAMTGNAQLGNVMANAKPIEATHTAEDLWLPARVRISIVLQTQDGDMPFETQARIRLQEPLDFNAPVSTKALENATGMNGAFPAMTPPGMQMPVPGAQVNPLGSTPRLGLP